MAIIARELALRLACLAFPPDVVHTPGVAHKLADALSRIHSPQGAGEINLHGFPYLAHAERSSPPARNSFWYKAGFPDPSSVEECAD